MSDNKSKKASKEAINTNGDSPKPDDDSEHTTMSKTNGNGNSNNGNNLLPHGKKNGSSGELSNSSKKMQKLKKIHLQPPPRQIQLQIHQLKRPLLTWQKRIWIKRDQMNHLLHQLVNLMFLKIR